MNNCSEKNEKVEKYYFNGSKNYIINSSLAIIPTGIVGGILGEIGLGGVFIITLILLGFIHLSGKFRERLGNRNSVKLQ